MLDAPLTDSPIQRRYHRFESALLIISSNRVLCKPISRWQSNLVALPQAKLNAQVSSSSL